MAGEEDFEVIETCHLFVFVKFVKVALLSLCLKLQARLMCLGSQKKVYLAQNECLLSQ